MDIFNILTLIGGLALFLFGMNVMGNSLENLSGSKLEKILEKLTSNRFKGVLIGFLVTSVIQSSSATTVMVVGFVNSGIMKLRQAIGIIMGANIGTTVTAWILSLTGIESENIFIQLLKPTSFTPILALIGIIFLLMTKSPKKKEIGTMLLGFAVLMFGMDIMSGAVKPLADIPEFTNILVMFSNPIFGVLIGAALTAVIQSSSASVGILQALSATGLVTYGTAIPIILGQNIGTCATAMISSIGANKNAKRAALVHLYFNIIGTILFLVLFYVLNALIGFAFVEDSANQAGIAVVHTVFNLFSTVVLFPFAGLLEKLAYFTIKPDKEEAVSDEGFDEFKNIDQRFLSMPAFAIEQCRGASIKMAELSRHNFLQSLDLINNYSKKTAEQIIINEDRIDAYEDRLGTYLVQIGNKNLLARDSQSVTMLLHLIGDFERISDHALNIMEACKEINKKELSFSDKAKEELSIYKDAVAEILVMAIDAFIEDDLEKARMVEPLEEVIDHLQIELKKRHIKRLRKGKCTIEMGFVFSDFLTNLERVADHCSNIAVCLIQIKENSFEMHEYVNELRKTEDKDFIAYYTRYNKKYKLP